MARLSTGEQFLVLFENLKVAAGTPQRMLSFYAERKTIRDACVALLKFLSETGLEDALLYGRRGKVVVSRRAAFESGWREYVENWRFRLRHDEGIPLVLDDDKEEWKSYWKTAHIELIVPKAAAAIELESPSDDDAAIEQGIEDLQRIVERYLELERGFTDDDELRELEGSCSTALSALNHLIDTVGLNLPSVFRRWRNVPVILMPAHVSKRYGASDKGSLLHLLDDAVQAYVFGAPAAAIAMCRAALDMVLKQHYGEGKWDRAGLETVVSLASKRFDFINENELKFLVRHANRILHDYVAVDRISPEDDRTIVVFLTTVKSLIERAPSG
jgi:hypothetical protein